MEVHQECSAVRADAARNRLQVLEAAWRLLADRQLEDFSMEDVAREAGVGKATLYRHYETREALIDALLREGEQKFWRRFQTCIPADADAPAKLRAIVSMVFDAYEHRQFNVNLLLSMRDCPRLRSQASAFSEFPIRLRAIIEQGISEGTLRPIDAEYAVQAALALVSPVTLRRTQHALDWDRERLESSVTDLLLHALGAA